MAISDEYSIFIKIFVSQAESEVIDSIHVIHKTLIILWKLNFVLLIKIKD